MATQDQLWKKMSGKQQTEFLKKYKDNKKVQKFASNQLAKTKKSPSVNMLTGEKNKAKSYNQPKKVNYGDVSGKSTAGQTQQGLRTSQGVQQTPKQQELGKYSVFGETARQTEAKTPGTLTQRNDIIAGNLFTQGKIAPSDVKEYLEGQQGFLQATPEEQANTIRAVQQRIGAIGGQQDGTLSPNKQVAKTLGTEGGPSDIDILNYDSFSPEEKILIDNMAPAQKKELSMIAGADWNAQLEYLRNYKREKEYSEEQRGRYEEKVGLEMGVQDIQSSQRIQQASNSLNNLKQNIAYLGSQGMPGKSAERIDAVDRQISRASEAFRQLKQIEADLKQARELGIEIDTASYMKQMSDLQEDLDRNVNEQIQSAMSEMSAADMKGELDTIGGIRQFKQSLLEKLDAKIDGNTQATLNQMRYVNDTYQQIADQAQADYKEYQHNANIINPEMSQAQGFMIDGNGQPVISMTTGQMIPMPTDAPMPPSYDKNTGRLVSFSYGPDGGIVANVDQVFEGASVMDGKMMMDVMGAISKGEMTSEQAKALFPSLATAIDAKAPGVGMTYGEGVPGQQVTVGPTTYTVPDAGGMMEGQIFLDGFKEGEQNFDANGNLRGQCGEFVNDYLRKTGAVDYNVFKDPIDVRKTQTNVPVDGTPSIGSVAVIEYQPGANVSDAAKEYGHVAVVEGINPDGTINIVESNVGGDKAIHRRTIDPKTKGVVGYFDPTKGPAEGGQQQIGLGVEATLARLERGNLNKSEYAELQAKAEREGWIDQYTQALKQGMKTELTPTQLKQWDTISDDIDKNQTYKMTDEIRGQADTVVSLLGQDVESGGFNDIALINTFQRIIDPGATVREGDVDLLQSSVALADKLSAEYKINQFKRGDKLPPEVRKDMLENALAVYNARARYANEVLDNRFKPRIENAGLTMEQLGATFNEIKPEDITIREDIPEYGTQPGTQPTSQYDTQMYVPDLGQFNYTPSFNR